MQSVAYLVAVAIAGLTQASENMVVEEAIQRLQVGQTCCFRVVAIRQKNVSQVLLESGAHYEFCVSQNDTWCDGRIRCSAGGWTAADVMPMARPLIHAAESKRRYPGANWFELVGAVGCDGCEVFRIGCRGSGWTYTPRRTGLFCAFANDLASRYHNNAGSVWVTIKRVAGPAPRQLPSCHFLGAK